MNKYLLLGLLFVASTPDGGNGNVTVEAIGGKVLGVSVFDGIIPVESDGENRYHISKCKVKRSQEILEGKQYEN